MVSGPADGTGDTVVVDSGTGEEVRRIESWGLCAGHPVHPTRPWLALQRADRPIRVVDYRTGEDVAKVEGRIGVEVAWHPTRPVLAISDASFRIHLVDVTTNREVLPPLEGTTTAGIRMRFDRPGDRLLSWDWSGMVRVWDLATGYQVFRTPVASMYAAWFAPGGDVLVARIAGRTRLQLPRVRLGEGLRVAADQPGPDRSRFDSAVCVSPDGRLLVARQRKGATEEITRVGDPVSGAELAALPSRTVPVGFERPSGALVTHHVSRGFERWPIAAADGGRVRIGPPRQLVAAGGFGLRAGMSTDGRVLVRPRPASDRGADILHLGGQPRTVATEPVWDIRFASVSPDGRWVVTGSHSGNTGIRVHDAGTGMSIARLHDCNGWGAFSPDGAWVEISDYRGEGKLVRAGTWADHLTLRGDPCFSPDGRLIAVGEGVGVVRLLGCETVALDPEIWPVAFESRDGIIGLGGGPRP
jgi:WD40 repeat protein